MSEKAYTVEDNIITLRPERNLEEDDLSVDDTGDIHMDDLHWSLFAEPEMQEIKKPTLDNNVKGLFEWDVPSKKDGSLKYRTQFIWWRDPAMEGDKIRLWVRVVGLSSTIMSPPFRLLGDDSVDGDRVGDLIELAYSTREMGNAAVKRGFEVQEDRNHKSGNKNLIDRAVEQAEMRVTIGKSISHYGPLRGGRTAGTQRDNDVLRSGKETYNG